MNSDNFFEIGIVTKAQGIRGEFRVFPTTDDPSRFSLLIGEEVFVREKNGVITPRKLIAARLQKSAAILKLDGIDDRNSAEAMVKAVILIPKEKSLPLGAGEYFVRDLIGLKAESESGEEIGVLEDVLHTGANDVYVIETPEGESFMLPAVKDFVKNVSDEKIVLHLIEGMRELTP